MCSCALAVFFVVRDTSSECLSCLVLISVILSHLYCVSGLINRRVSNGGQYQFLFHNIFPYTTHGVFVEAGAADPLHANTFMFERELCWTGLCVEPLVRFHHQTQAARPDCSLIKGALSNKAGHDTFLTVQEDPFLSGLESEMNPSNFEMIKARNLTTSRNPITLLLLGDLLLKRKMLHVDLLVLDCEGCEEKVVTSFPWAKINVGVVMIEAPTQATFIHLTENGYAPVACASFDTIFMKQGTERWALLHHKLPPLTSTCSFAHLNTYSKWVSGRRNQHWADVVFAMRANGTALNIPMEEYKQPTTTDSFWKDGGAELLKPRKSSGGKKSKKKTSSNKKKRKGSAATRKLY